MFLVESQFVARRRVQKQRNLNTREKRRYVSQKF